MLNKIRTFKQLLFSILLALMSGFLICCNPADKINTSPSLRLNFSADTVLFDTVFTSIGSSTRSFKVYNRNNYRVNIFSGMQFFIVLTGFNIMPHGIL